MAEDRLKSLVDRLEAAYTRRMELGEYNETAAAVTALYGDVLELAMEMQALERRQPVSTLGEALRVLTEKPLPVVNDKDEPIKR